MPSKPNLLFVAPGSYAHLVVVDREEGIVSREIVTCRLHTGRYIRVDDGRQYPQLCAGGASMGNTLDYSTDEQLARDCDARLFKTRERFDAAVARARAVVGSDPLDDFNYVGSRHHY
jgi:hypothetical protein